MNRRSFLKALTALAGGVAVAPTAVQLAKPPSPLTVLKMRPERVVFWRPDMMVWQVTYFLYSIRIHSVEYSWNTIHNTKPNDAVLKILDADAIVAFRRVVK